MKLPGAEDKELIQPQEPKVKQRHLGLDEDFRILGFWRMQKKIIEIPQRLENFPNLQQMDEIHVNFLAKVYIL